MEPSQTLGGSSPKMTTAPFSAKQNQKKSHQPKGPMAATDAGLPRIVKAASMTDGVTFTTDTTASVLSSDGVTLYWVTLSPDGKHVCNCPDNSIRGNVCKHIRATLMKQMELKMTTEADNK